jgi:hypothetical protein
VEEGKIDGLANKAKLSTRLTSIMAISRSARITLLLIIDLLFFFVELIVGEYQHLSSHICPLPSH